MQKISIKNMVCPRCIKSIELALKNIDIEFSHIELGTIYLTKIISESKRQSLRNHIEQHGFEIVDDKNTKIIESIKTLIINEIHHGKNEKRDDQTFSDFISKKLNIDYSSLSKLFSSIEGKTIEKYIIAQRIEKAKELLIYNELNPSEISYQLGYSSPQHFSGQFKQITGSSPSQFKTQAKQNRYFIDKV